MAQARMAWFSGSLRRQKVDRSRRRLPNEACDDKSSPLSDAPGNFPTAAGRLDACAKLWLWSDVEQWFSAAPAGHLSWRHFGATIEAMPSVQIKNVPDDVHRVLRRRAKGAGQSLQEYLLERLSQDARQATLEDVFNQAPAHTGSLGFDFAAKAARDDRDRL